MRFSRRVVPLAVALTELLACLPSITLAADHIRDLQTEAITQNKAPWGYWGLDPAKYTGWTNHSNRLIPAYTFGIDLASVKGKNSIYRDAKRLQELYGRVPDDALHPEAEYFDQTDIARLQRAALAAGKKYVVLIVFDGMDWQTTQAAAIYKSGKVGYAEGRGTGLYFQDYRGTETDYGFFVSSPASDASAVDVDAQTVLGGSPSLFGGYNPRHGGAAPWSRGDDPAYLIGKSREGPHAVTDSAASATSLCAGIKTYNVSINIDPQGRQATPVSHEFQAHGYSVGVVTSVPISHATPACVMRIMFLAMISRISPAISSGCRRSRIAQPLAGVDVLIGAGWGESVDEDRKQGSNFTPGNKYLAAEDLARIDARLGGKYVVAQREAGKKGRKI